MEEIKTKENGIYDNITSDIEEIKIFVKDVVSHEIEKVKGNSHGRIMTFWLWFQKHAFTTIIFIAIGILVGISATKIIYESQIRKAINVQRFEFKGELFEVHPSTIEKYYDPKVKQFTVSDKK